MGYLVCYIADIILVIISAVVKTVAFSSSILAVYQFLRRFSFYFEPKSCFRSCSQYKRVSLAGCLKFHS